MTFRIPEALKSRNSPYERDGVKILEALYLGKHPVDMYVPPKEDVRSTCFVFTTDLDQHRELGSRIAQDMKSLVVVASPLQGQTAHYSPTVFAYHFGSSNSDHDLYAIDFTDGQLATKGCERMYTKVLSLKESEHLKRIITPIQGDSIELRL